MKNFALALVLGVSLAGCSQVTGQIKEIVGNDLVRTSELAAKYGKPEVKQCADFLNAALSAQDGQLAQLDALLKEPTEGLLSAALKAALIAELGRSLNDPAAQSKFKADFDVNCKAVAGQIVIDLARDARKVGSRGMF